MSGRRPHGPRRGLRLLLAAFGAVVGVLLTGATGAFGYWLAVSAGNPSAAAADALPIGATPSAATTPSANSTTVAITFAAASTSLGNVAIPAGNYTLRRYPTVGAPVPVTATCTGITTITCTASNVPDGTWQYTDTPTYGLDWVGTESAKSAPVVVDATASGGSCAVGGLGLCHRPVGAGRSGDRHRHRRLRGQCQHGDGAARLRDPVRRHLRHVQLIRPGHPHRRQRHHRALGSLLPIPATSHRQRRQHNHLGHLQHRQGRHHLPHGSDAVSDRGLRHRPVGAGRPGDRHRHRWFGGQRQPCDAAARLCDPVGGHLRTAVQLVHSGHPHRRQ